MKAKYIVMLITCLLTASVFAQSNLNNYKYVIVPSKYDFLKDKDEYQLNSLTKFLFEKYGFDALIEGEKYPEDLIRNRCLALKSDLIKDSGMFKTKLAVELKDCNDQVVFTSLLGESREKEYSKAYNEALRNAFKSIETLNYKYVPSNVSVVEESKDVLADTEAAKEIQQLKEEIESLKIEKETAVVVKTELEMELLGKVQEKDIPVVVIPTKDIPVKEVKTVSATPEKMESSGILYAQETENGFQLVDSAPKVVYRIKRTGIADVFLVENKNATVYKKGADWVLEYYENNVLKQEVLNIKF
ncbi:MAG: putative Zn finger protein [Mariniflexile sp.]|jgi:uncharacterized Zn finger protein